MNEIPTIVPPAIEQVSENVTKPRGFAALKLRDPARVSQLAKLGGIAAHVAGTAHEFTPEEASTAGRKGGLATHARRRAAKVAA